MSRKHRNYHQQKHVEFNEFTAILPWNLEQAIDMSRWQDKPLKHFPDWDKPPAEAEELAHTMPGMEPPAIRGPHTTMYVRKP